MKTQLKLTLLAAASVLITGCTAANTPVQNTQGTVVNASKKQAPQIIHDPHKQKKYSSPVGNKAGAPQPASQPSPYTSPYDNNDNNSNAEAYDTMLPGALSSPGTHSAFSD
jgi:uncharacterized lipoprotein